jgi:hypothetical protein
MSNFSLEHRERIYFCILKTHMALQLAPTNGICAEVIDATSRDECFGTHSEQISSLSSQYSENRQGSETCTRLCVRNKLVFY